MRLLLAEEPHATAMVEEKQTVGKADSGQSAAPSAADVLDVNPVSVPLDLGISAMALAVTARRSSLSCR